MDKIEVLSQISEKAFLAEQERAKNLTDKSEKYISAIAIIIGFQLLDINTLKIKSLDDLYNLLAIIGLFALVVAFVTAFTSNRLYTYHSYPAADQYRSIFENNQVDEVSAKTAFLKMYWKLLDINIPLNDNRAKLLKVSANLITIGFLLMVTRYIVQIIIK